MKKLLFFTVCILCVYVCNAQSTSYTNLGILCYINVSLSHDPVDNQGYLTYTINTPMKLFVESKNQDHLY